MEFEVAGEQSKACWYGRKRITTEPYNEDGGYCSYSLPIFQYYFREDTSTAGNL